MSEKCDRCGCVGEDRRTLWHACFYAMEELKIPFEEKILFHAKVEELEKAADPVSINLSDGKKINIQAGRVRCSGELTPHTLYCLRVCKRCRGEWLETIRTWFFAVPEGIDHDADVSVDEDVNSGIFIRENGAIKEISREEWDRRNPKREPARVKK